MTFSEILLLFALICFLPAATSILSRSQSGCARAGFLGDQTEDGE
jgi:hypothetical protein